MKLIKTSDGRCRVKTRSGSQCSRKAKRNGLCTQHYKIMCSEFRYGTSIGSKLLDSVPDPPSDMGNQAREMWAIYCSALLARGDLRSVYLPGIEHLCWLEAKLQQYRCKFQDEGYSSTIGKLSTDIRMLRDAYGLTSSSRPDKTETQPSTFRKDKSF